MATATNVAKKGLRAQRREIAVADSGAMLRAMLQQ